MTPSILPSPRTWILHFKHHRTTILLHVDALQKLSSVRTELLAALYATNPNGTLNGHQIPDSESEVLLARPRDQNDLSAGWETIGEDDEEESFVPEEDKKGKGKAAAGSAKGRPSKDKITDCPQGAGLRDGGIVAFKFRSEMEAARKDEDEGIDVEGDEEKLDGETLVGEPPSEAWDVVVPTMEETYGEEGAAQGMDTEAVESSGK